MLIVQVAHNLISDYANKKEIYNDTCIIEEKINNPSLGFSAKKVGGCRTRTLFAFESRLGNHIAGHTVSLHSQANYYFSSME